jgi:hypothetical protein
MNYSEQRKDVFLRTLMFKELIIARAILRKAQEK